MAATDVDWAFPGRGAKSDQPADAVTKLSLPGAPGRFTAAETQDTFRAVDWRPASHSPMPPVVAFGRQPKVWACGFCHMPAGEGRPENASLAGLPRSYIVKQVKAFAAQTRTSVGRGWFPSATMTQVAKDATPAEINAAADYFSHQTFHSRLRVQEAATVAAPRADAFLFQAGTGAVQPIGVRIVEGPSSMTRFETRDTEIDYVAYVPVGSLVRGATLAGGKGGVQACAGCHGAGLKGGGLGPPLAGRSPSYMFRQLLAFQTGARNDADATPMKAVVAKLAPADMIALAAYVGSLKP